MNEADHSFPSPCEKIQDPDPLCLGWWWLSMTHWGHALSVTGQKGDLPIEIMLWSLHFASLQGPPCTLKSVIYQGFEGKQGCSRM